MSDPRGMTSQLADRLDSAAFRATVLVVVLAVMVLSLAVPLRKFIRQSDENSQLAQELDTKQARVGELEQRVKQWEQPAFVASQARERLHFVFPGEVAFTVLGDGRPPVIGTPPKSKEQSEGWYSRMWNSVRDAGG